MVTSGGIGTILELFYTWQLAQVKQLADKPLILMGEMWLDLLKWMRAWPLKNNLLDEAALALVNSQAPFPAFPAQIQVQDLWIDITIIYRPE